MTSEEARKRKCDQWRKKNKDKIREYNRKSREKNLEKILKRGRECDRERRKTKEYQDRWRRWRLENPAPRKPRILLTTEEKKERIRQRSRRWYLENHERAKEKSRETNRKKQVSKKLLDIDDQRDNLLHDFMEAVFDDKDQQ